MTASRWRWIAAGLAAAIAAAAGWQLGLAAVRRETGYLAPVFSPDGRSIFVVRREVTVVIPGAVEPFVRAPSEGRVRHDQFSLVNIRIADGALTVVETLPPTPLEGTVTSGHGSGLFGPACAYLRWADGSHLDYEMAVAQDDGLLSSIFVTRKVWSPASGAPVVTGPWIGGSIRMLSVGPNQLWGDLEVIAPLGDAGMGCAVVLMNKASSATRVLAETGSCRRKYPDGYPAAVVAPLSRRAEIERSEMVRRTYDELVARGRKKGLPEGQAMLNASEEMNRIGLYPKTAMLAATRRDCAGASPVFDIADAQFDAGLYSDIERAIALTGRRVPKAPGAYSTAHDDTTSRQIDAHLDAGNSTFVVRARGACWEMWVEW